MAKNSSIIFTIARALKAEPVAVATVVGAATALATAIEAHKLTDGIITAAVMAVAGLFARNQVTPTP